MVKGRFPLGLGAIFWLTNKNNLWRSKGKNKVKISAWLSVLTLASAGPALAGPIADAAAQVESQLNAGDAAGALLALGEIYSQVWAQNLTIGFTQGLLVSQPSTGYGVYNPRPTNVFKKGEPILIYCEPFGFDYSTPGEGLYSVNLFVDLQVLDASGNQLAKAPEATEIPDRRTAIAAAIAEAGTLPVGDGADVAFHEWCGRWLARLTREPGGRAGAVAVLRRSNPVIIPRNHRVEEALAAAAAGDLTVLERLLAVLRDPYVATAANEPYRSGPPQGCGPYRTFCGT